QPLVPVVGAAVTGGPLLAPAVPAAERSPAGGATRAAGVVSSASATPGGLAVPPPGVRAVAALARASGTAVPLAAWAFARGLAGPSSTASITGRGAPAAH